MVLLPTGAFRHRGATRWSHLGTPQGWVGGPYVDEDDANDHVTATNDVSAYDNSLQLVTAFTAGTTHYQWFNVVSETPQLTDAEVVDGTSDVAGTISGSQLDDFAPELGIAEATSKVSDEFGRASGRRIGEAIDAHVVRSTNATTDVAETSAIGTSLELSRDDHVHRLATDDTLHRDGAGQLGVNINDIIEQVSETVQYFTDSTGNFDDSNHATMGEEYTTSRWQKAIHKVEIHIGHQAGDGILQYRAGVHEVEEDGEIITVFGRSAIRDVGNSGRWIFNFHPPVRVDPSSRIIIVATREDEGNSTTARVLEGSESGDSPNISYMDAGEDFDRVHRVTYTEDYPVVGTTRHSHDAAFVRGNIKIWYTNTYHEGLLVGEESINAAHINSESAADGEVLTADGSGGAAWEASSGGDGGGSATELTQAMVEDDADTTFGLVSGERLSQAVAVFESSGGGGSGPAPVTLLDARAIPTGSSATQVTLAGGSLTDAQVLSFKVVGSSGSTSYATALAADIRALTVQAATPTTATTNSLALRIQGLNQATINNVQTNVLRVWYVDDDTLYVAQARGVAHSITITALPVGGGALTTSEQESLANARVLTSRVFNGSGNGIATLGSGTTWPTNSPNTFVVTATEYADVERIELVFRQNGKVGLPYIITKGVLDEIPAGAFMPNSPANTQTIRGVFYAGRIGPSHRNTNYWVINPRFDFMEERRGASDNCILIQYGLNGTLFTGVFIRARQPSGGLIFQHAELFYWEDA